MPGIAADHAAPVTVQVTDAPFALPGEGELTDAVASAQLTVLFNTYQEMKRQAPRLPGEKSIVPALHFRPNEVQAMIDQAVGKYREWLDRIEALTLSIMDLGETNPGASFALIGKSGRVLQVNGTKLFEAIMRTEAEILGGQVRN